MVPKSQDAISFVFEKSGAQGIVSIFRVLAAIGFNNQSLLLADEVGDKRPDRLLAAELGAVQLAVSQRGPELSLGIRHLVTQTLCICERFASIAGHALTLPPLRGSLPLPRGERGLGAACSLHPTRRT